MDQVMLFGTVGITDRLDVSVAIPIASVRMGGSSTANIIRVSGQNFTPVGSPSTVLAPNPHQFDAAGHLTATFSSSGSASGIGDITIRAKGTVLQFESTRVALGLDVRAPSGDARQFLGAGAMGVKPFLAVSMSKRVAPHANIGYQWNGQSILAGNITGTTVSESSAAVVTIQNGPATTQKLPGQFYYAVGIDVGMPKQRMTFAFDYLGQALFNAPRVFQTTFVTTPIPGGTGGPPQTLNTIGGTKDNMVMNSGAAGLKYNIYRNLLLTGDVLFRLDNKGLRQNVTPLAALSYSFGK